MLAARGDRLGCQCGQPDCPAGGRAASAVMIHVIADHATIDGTSPAPGAMIGFEGLLPPELIAELARAARLRPLTHPRGAAPEPAYTPSRALAEFVRLRDLTCRFPGCHVPATQCDVDHLIPYRSRGPTHASNLSCKCRTHHLLKTFWGWRDEQLPDGTLIVTSPAGERYVTTPGSALIFPHLCAPTGPITITPRADQCGDRTVMMPRRRRTRDQQRAAAITAERRHNHQRRTTPTTPVTRCDEDLDYEDTLPIANDTSPPPF